MKEQNDEMHNLCLFFRYEGLIFKYILAYFFFKDFHQLNWFNKREGQFNNLLCSKIVI